MASPKHRPSIAELRALGTIPARDIDLIENYSIRLIQIGDEVKVLESEKGFTKDGERYPGVADDLEALFITYDLVETGIDLEDYMVIHTGSGGQSRVDPHLLLAEGVSAKIIARCTVTSGAWSGVQARRKPLPKQ